MIKLNLGSGEKFIPGFTHIDVKKFEHIDYVAEVDNLSMYEDESVDLIYASHLLEHFERNRTKEVIKEWYRVLKVGGMLRIAVPDFEKIVEVYQKYHDIDLIMGLLYGRQDYKYNFHYRAFDFNSLERLFKDSGFKAVKKYDWRKTVHKDYDDFSQAYIPHMDKENGVLVSLNVEAVK